MITYLQKISPKIFSILFFNVAVFSCNILFAQVSFTTVCPQKKIGKNDYLQIQFKVDHASNVEVINPPTFKNFSIVSGPNQESGMTSINGSIDQYVSISFILKPHTTGNFTIGSATAKADGKDLHTAPLAIQVTNASSSSSAAANSAASPFPSLPNLGFDFAPAPATHDFDDYILKKGENVSEKVKKNLFIKLDVSKTSCYVGEPIVASYKLYTRLRSESTITDAPSFNGFSVNDLDVNSANSSGTEKYNGRDYNVYTLRKAELYPLQPGLITLDPVVADNKVTFIKADYAGSQQGDTFFDMMQNFADGTPPQDAVVVQDVTLKSKPVEITVKPLPEENRPEDFKGTVGNFTIQSSLQKNNITTDDAGNLQIVIKGAGNIQLINAPKISWPQGMDGYDAKITDGIDKSSVPMQGSKTFTYPFTVSKAGNYLIPAVSFSYFDPASASYKTLSTLALSIAVTKGNGIPKNPYAKSISKQENSGIGLQNSDIIYLLGVIILVAFTGVWLVQKKKSRKRVVVTTTGVNGSDDDDKDEEKEPEFVIPEHPLEDAYSKLVEENGPEFYHVLDASLNKYLSAKFKVPAEELTKKRINEELDKCNVGLGTSIRLSNLMENIELNLYAPASSVSHLKEVYEKASEVISLLDKQC